MEKNKIPYDSPAYKRSRKAYNLECAFEYFVSLLVTDAFLAKILTAIGFSDEATGIMSSMISLAFLFQLFSVFVIRKVTNTKIFAILFHSTSQLFFLSLYLIPFLPFAEDLKQPLAVLCLLLAYFGNYMVTSLIFRWGNSFVRPEYRARFSATKEIISLVSGMVVSLGIGYAMDYFDMTGGTERSFIFAAVCIFIFCLADLVTLLLIQNDIKPKMKKGEGATFSEIMKNTLGNKSFVSVMILMTLWEMGRYFTVGFLGTYKLADLGYTLGLIQVINIVSNLARAALSRPFGWYTDRRTFAKGVELGLLVAFAAFAVGIFATPEMRILIIVHTVLYNVCMAGIYANLINITYSYVDSRYFAEASAIKNSIAGFMGFVASLIGGKILSAVQENGNMLFGIPVYGQQVLFAISSVIFLIAILFTHFIVSKQKVIVQ